MIRGKAAVMFDPTKLLPQNQQNVDLVIRQKKAVDEGGISSPIDAPDVPLSPTSEQQTSISATSPTSTTSTTSTTTTTNPDDDHQNLNHFSRPKVAGRRQVRIVQQDTTQRRQQVALELVQSEKMYFTMLEAFAKSFIAPLKDNATNFGIQPSNVLSLSETLEQIITFSYNFGNNPKLSSEPALVFEENFQTIQDLYQLYLNKSIHHIFGLLNDLTGNKRFRQHVKHVQGDLNTNIIDHFLIPATRFSVYELLLRKYAQSSDEQQSKQLIILADRIKDQTQELLPLTTELERAGAVLNLQLQLSMSGSNVVYLWNPERQLIHKTVAMKSKIDLKDVQSTANFETRTHGENKRQMLLFNDQLMWTTPTQEARYKGHVSLVDITVEVFGPDEIPALLVKQQNSGNNTNTNKDNVVTKKDTKTKDTKQPQQAQNIQQGDSSKEGWVLIFEDVKVRNTWYREIKSLQAQLIDLTTDSTLTIPIEVKDETQGGCCTIM